MEPLCLVGWASCTRVATSGSPTSAQLLRSIPFSVVAAHELVLPDIVIHVLLLRWSLGGKGFRAREVSRWTFLDTFVGRHFPEVS